MKVIESATRFPLRRLMVCFTLWLIVSEALFFDQLKFNTRVGTVSFFLQTLRSREPRH